MNNNLIGNRIKFPTKSFVLVAFSSLFTNANAAQFFYNYDASIVPDAPALQNIFSTNAFSGTSWSSTGGELTLNTQSQAGIWFGNHPSFDQVPWQIADTNLGNSISITTKLGSNSGEWNLYLHDGNYSASLYFLPGKVNIGGFGDHNIDTSAYHDYTFQLGGGKVLYKIDGTEVFFGDAVPSNQSKILVIGDGSGVNPVSTGYGTMYIDNVNIQTETGIPASVPIPATVWLFSSALFGFGIVGKWRNKYVSA